MNNVDVGKWKWHEEEEAFGTCKGNFAYTTHAGLETIINSPGYPDRYEDNLDCIYNIVTDPNYIISLSFINVDIEACTNCNCDYLEIHDGLDASAPSLGRYCGTDIKDITSSGNRMWIIFHTDGQTTRNGFSISYKRLDRSAEFEEEFYKTYFILKLSSWYNYVKN